MVRLLSVLRGRRPRARRATRAPMTAADPARAPIADDLRAGVEELVEFIHDVGGGKIGEPIVQGNDIHVALTARDGEEYILKITVTSYLVEPPQCTFVDRSFDESPQAWPYPHPMGPFRSPAFICTPPTAEFYASHGERVYRHGEGSLVNTVATIFAALYAPQYVGRLTPGSLDRRRLRL